MNRASLQARAWSVTIMVVSCIIYALGFDWFFAPNDMAFGGITGLAQVANAVFPMAPVGVLVILFNVPLFLLGWKLLGGRVLVSSLFCMALSSVFLDLIAAVYTFPPMDPMLAALFGGVFTGASLGLVFREGATTGGTDLAARLLKLPFHWLPVGKLLLCVDLVVIALVAIAFHNLSSALYGIVALYVSTLVMDTVLYSGDMAKMAYIISAHPKELTDFILKELDRGVTLLEGRGAYSGEDKEVILCVFKRRQIVPLKKAIQQIDPEAFLIVCEAREVFGDGFKGYKLNDL